MANFTLKTEGKIHTCIGLGASLRTKRHLKTLNQIEVTEKTGIPLRKIRAFEHGQIIDFFDFVRYAEFLGVNIGINAIAEEDDEMLTEAQSLII